MRISRIQIKNFRSMRDFEMEPEDGINLLVGENNAGKSALLAALGRALGRGGQDFELEDFYVEVPTTAPADLPTISIDIEIKPTVGPTFSSNFTAEFEPQITLDEHGSPLLIFRTQAHYSKIEERVVTEYFSVRADGLTRSMGSSKRFLLRGYIPFYLVDAFRDTIRDIEGRRGFWGRIVNSITIDPSTTASIESSVHAINQSIVNAAPRIGELENRLREIGNAIPTSGTSDDVVINPITVDPSRILRNLDVILRTASAPRGFGIARHGEGTRSVAYLAIFRAFVDLMAQDENDNVESTPFLGIEEPEVHLHPHAIRALGAVLATPSRQMFFTTHSPEMAQSIELTSIQVLKRGSNGTERRVVPKSNPGGGPLLEQKDRTKLERALRTGAMEILFSRAAILCEGPSETQSYPYFASALAIDLNKLSLSLVSVDGGYFFHLLRIMADDALQIPWIVSADGDSLHKLAIQLVTLGKVTSEQLYAAENADTVEADVLKPNDFFTLPNGYNFEEALIRSGCAAEYQMAIDEHVGPDAVTEFLANTGTATRTLEDNLVAFLKSDARTGGKKWKVLLAGIVAEQITTGGTNSSRIPPPVVDALRLAEAYAKGATLKVS